MIGRSLSHYTILEQVGAGGMGVVYRGRDDRLDRDVAVKVLPAHALEDPAARKRFRQEALALSRLNHPHIEIVYDIGSEGPLDYLVLEFVPGETLAARLARGPLAEREAAELGAEIAEALDEAHLQGVLHRDLKPGNVMVTPKGRAKVLDFGLARVLPPGGDLTQTHGLTQPGHAAGTPAYMAPEQLLGRPLDARTDLYALGVMLYEMVTSRRPFQATLVTALTDEILHADLPAPRSIRPDLSPDFEAIILRSMQRDPGRRYQTAGEIVGELLRVAAGRAVAAPAAGAASADVPTAGASSRRITSIAVLPLENLSGDTEQEYFVDGMTEELIATLAQIRALRTIPRSSVMRFKGAHKPVGEIAQELNVDAVVEGSVRRSGERVRITAQLVDPVSDRHLWAKSYERDVRDVFALQGEVARAITEEIQVNVTPQEEARLRGARQIHPAAFESYLKGRFHWDRRTEESLHRGLGCFQDATRLDPGYALAHVGIADAYNLLGYYAFVRPEEAFPNAKAAARQALDIDPGCGEAHASLAYAFLYYDWDFAGAERLFRTAIERAPHHLVSHLWFGNVLLVTQRFEEARAEFRIARSLDPLSMISSTAAGWVSYYNHQFEEAIPQFRSALELEPDFVWAHHWLGLSYVEARRLAEAHAEFTRCLAIGGRQPMTLSGAAYAAAAAGDASGARALLEELDGIAAHRYVCAYFRVPVLIALGERDRALDALEQAVAERTHWVAFIRVDPAMDPLRGDPRFEEIARRVAIPA